MLKTLTVPDTNQPAKTDKEIQWQASRLGVGLNLIYKNYFPTGQNGETLPSYRVVVGCTVSGKNTQEVAHLIANRMMPATAREIEGWLAELSTIVAKRKDDAVSEIVRLSAFSSRLSQYPADIVRHVLLVKSWQYWPTWAELEKICNDLTAPRLAMLNALEQKKTTPKKKPTFELPKLKTMAERKSFTKKIWHDKK